MTKVIEPNDIYKCLDLQDLPGEIWKGIDGCECSYQISNLGRAKSLERLKRGKGGSFSKVSEKIIRLSFNGKGYLHFSLRRNGFKRKNGLVHKLVAIAFIPNPENKPQVNHKKGIKFDNRASELEWSTPKENNQHAIMSGLSGSIGETNHNAKLTDENVLVILQMVRDGTRDVVIASQFGVQPPAIYKIKTGRKWSHLTGIKKPCSEKGIASKPKNP